MNLKLNFEKQSQEEYEEMLEKFPNLLELCPVPYQYVPSQQGTLKVGSFTYSANLISKDHLIGLSLNQPVPLSTDSSDSSAIYKIDYLLSVLHAMKNDGLDCVDISIIDDAPICISDHENGVMVFVANRIFEEED